MDLTTGLPFSGRPPALDASRPTDDWEALRSFHVVHDVRRRDIVCIFSMVHISGAVFSNTSKALPLQQGGQGMTTIASLTVSADIVLTQMGDDRERDIVTSSDTAADSERTKTVNFAV